MLSNNPRPIVYPIETVTSDKSTVHTSYDPDSPPPHPGKDKYTRFICISDTHTSTFRIPPGDVLLHSGDLTHFGVEREVKEAVDWLREQPHTKKVVIAGNHDLTLDVEYYKGMWTEIHEKPEDTDAIKALMTIEEDPNFIYLEYASTTIQGKEGGKHWKIYGSPGSPEYGDMAFNYDRGEEAIQLHAKIPDDTDILLTHGPPLNVLDQVSSGEAVGCAALSERLDKIRPALHVFGHIHEARGAEIKEWDNSPDRPRTVFVNASNTPSGKKALDALRATEGRMKVGGYGFLPIIVDLWDPVSTASTVLV